MLIRMLRSRWLTYRRRVLQVTAPLVAVLALAAGLTLSGSQATASSPTTTVARPAPAVVDGSHITFGAVTAAAMQSLLTQSASTLTESAATVGNGANITFSYSTPAATVSSTNWVGIYEPGQVPGQVYSTTYEYAPGPSGSVTISTSTLNGVGPYDAFYLYNNGYQQLAGPLGFTVVGEPPAPAPHLARVLSPGGNATLNDPFGVAVDNNGDVWVADTGNNRIEELTPGGAPLAVMGSGVLQQPEGVAMGSGGDVWVADTGDNRLVEFSPDGTVVSTVGEPGSGPGQFGSPTAITIAVTGPSAGDIYVADQDNNRVQEFSAGGAYVSSVQVATPDGVAIDPSGDLWVSSPSYANGNAVYEFSPTGDPIGSFGSTQASFGALSDTAGIAVTGSGLIVVVQQDYSWVTVFNPDSSFNTEFGLQPGLGGSANLEFPQGVTISPAGNIYVADSGNNRVVEYSPPPSWNEAAI
jgi:sugar lactone lactonase YvrE